MMDEVISYDYLEIDLRSHREKVNSRIREIRAKKFYKTQELDEVKALRDKLNKSLNILRDKGMTVNRDDYMQAANVCIECMDYFV